MYVLLADLVVLLHLAFVLFVVLGGLLVWRRRRLVWVHLPAAAWGIGIEFTGAVCPLTPLENWLRLRGGVEACGGEFIGRYVLPLLYPTELTREVQIVLGAVALAVNATIYASLWMNRQRGGP